MDPLDVALTMVKMAIPIVIGFVAHKLGYMDEKIDTSISAIILNVTIPCMLIASAGSVSEAMEVSTVLELLGFSTLAHLIMLVMALVIPRLLRVEKSLQGVYGFMVMYGNVGLIGYPVIAAIYGDEALVYAAISSIPQSLFVFSIGYVMISGQMGSVREMLASCVKQMLSPTLISSAILLVLVLLGVNDLGVLGDGLELAGEFTTPAALLVCGSTIARYRPAEVFSNWRAYVIAACRLVLVPVVLLLVLGPFMTDDLVRGVVVVGLSMPVANNGLLFCLDCGVDTKPMIQSTVISIIGSIGSIPLAVMLAAL